MKLPPWVRFVRWDHATSDTIEGTFSVETCLRCHDERIVEDRHEWVLDAYGGRHYANSYKPCPDCTDGTWPFTQEEQDAS